jgi:hypothetical protein
MILNRIADFLSEVWSIRIARSRAIRRRAVGFQRRNADHSVFIKRKQKETTVLLVFSVYFSKFTSKILILVRKAASKQVE